MTIRRRIAVLLIAPVAALSAMLCASAGELSLSASTPEVSISTRPAGRNFMRLPTLRYDFVVNTDCPAGLSPEAVSLSIADTRVTNAVDEAMASAVPLTVNVPASQIGPVAVNQFCTAETIAEQGSHTLRLSSVLSVQSSLLCVGETGNNMTYTSASLDVLLRCEVEGEAETHTIRR